MDEYPWMPIARSYLGQHEVPGPAANQFIVECLRDFTDVDRAMAKSDETAWCSAFANRCVAEAGLEGTNSAWARSWLDWGREPENDEEYAGAIVVLERGPNSGHVGFLNDWGDGWVELLGGNQGDSVSLARFSDSRVLGYRVPV